MQPQARLTELPLDEIDINLGIQCRVSPLNRPARRHRRRHHQPQPRPRTCRIWQLLSDPLSRHQLREAIIARYFPEDREKLAAFAAAGHSAESA